MMDMDFIQDHENIDLDTSEKVFVSIFVVVVLRTLCPWSLVVSSTFYNPVIWRLLSHDCYQTVTR